MSLKQLPELNEEVLNQLAGLTGLGWTASMLGFLSAIIGYGDGIAPRPHWFLSLAVVFFVATLGLDRLRKQRSNNQK